MAQGDGFIAGIFRHCDRWCEACAFTARCRLFADLARVEGESAATDDAVDAALERGAAPALPGWMQVLLANRRAEQTRATPVCPIHAPLPAIAPEHRAIYERAGMYADWVRCWLRRQSHTGSGAAHGEDPIAVIAWFAAINGSKIFHALTGLAAFDGTRTRPAHHEGAAKVALIGLERSQAAWRRLAADGVVPDALAARWVRELEWMAQRLEEVMPLARRFVRPGFDEPG